MRTNITNLFYIKKAKPNKNGEVPIYHRVTIEGKRIESSTGKFIHPTIWSSDAGKVIGKTEIARSINSHLTDLQIEINEAERYLIANNKNVDYPNLKNVLKKDQSAIRTIIPIFKNHNDRLLALVDAKKFALGTWKNFRTTMEHLVAFMKKKYNRQDIAINEIDLAFIMDFDFYLRTEKNCANNTTIKYVYKVHKIFKICIDNEWIQKDPFAKYNSKLSIVDRGYLNQFEIDSIINKRIENPRLALVRDIFVFSCYTGLSYIEVQNLKIDHISIGIDGHKWIFIDRQKTNSPSHIPLLPIALDLIKKYECHPKCIDTRKVMPILSNQRMNSYLKEIGDICGIKKELTFHLARHSFATTITLTNGVPLESVGKMLGHRNIRSTQIYARVLDDKLSKDMLALKQIISERTSSHLLSKENVS